MRFSASIGCMPPLFTRSTATTPYLGMSPRIALQGHERVMRRP